MRPSALDRLAADEVAATVTALSARIEARFPGRGLTRVAEHLTALVATVDQLTTDTAVAVRRARGVARAATGLVVLAAVALLALAARDAASDRGPDSSLDWLPLLESAVNDVVFVAIAVFFLWSVPERLQRRSILQVLHRLRSLAHVIDMHQLTKDPERLRERFRATAVSPDNDLDRDQMERYLDYCSELLSLVGKAAALCAETSQDPVVLDSVGDLETLTTGMSRKIWQKIEALPE
ncbi:MAG: hypothetical protein F2667_01935 [Actinobacteria bacterium]|uniref:Unannotated protein n=1 Tax=freshwater metagenome TaxID=449393 RepID=A0A6J6NUU5_9ZZZZ|nr:hypothetical protein [Actinomycetota bacterium]